MMKNMVGMKWMSAMLVLGAGATLSPVSGATLKVGDPAPQLQAGKWVQGEPVKEFQRDKAYIVEFWATWCGPCRVSIPHLNEIYVKFKDKGLVVIGQDCWENDETLVEPFVKKMGDKMTYRVVLDSESGQAGQMAKTWMTAAGQNGIPTAFVIDKHGQIAWIGYPMTLKDELLQQVLDGKFDVKKAAAEYEARAKEQQQMESLSQKFADAMKDKKWDDAESALAEIEKVLPEQERSNVGPARFGILLGKGDYKAASKLASDLSDAHKDNAMLQNQLAWELLTHEGVKDRDLELAERIATRANDAAQGNDPAIVDTLARALFLQGKKDKAIELQEKAVSLAPEEQRPLYRKTLESYKEGKVPESA